MLIPITITICAIAGPLAGYAIGYRTAWRRGFHAACRFHQEHPELCAKMQSLAETFRQHITKQS